MGKEYGKDVGRNAMNAVQSVMYPLKKHSNTAVQRAMTASAEAVGGAYGQDAGERHFRQEGKKVGAWVDNELGLIEEDLHFERGNSSFFSNLFENLGSMVDTIRQNIHETFEAMVDHILTNWTFYLIAAIMILLMLIIVIWLRKKWKQQRIRELWRKEMMLCAMGTGDVAVHATNTTPTIGYEDFRV